MILFLSFQNVSVMMILYVTFFKSRKTVWKENSESGAEGGSPAGPASQGCVIAQSHEVRQA